jgi:hypothetical protein
MNRERRVESRDLRECVYPSPVEIGHVLYRRNDLVAIVQDHESAGGSEDEPGVFDVDAGSIRPQLSPPGRRHRWC